MVGSALDFEDIEEDLSDKTQQPERSRAGALEEEAECVLHSFAATSRHTDEIAA